MSDSRKIYDISPEKRQVIEWKAARRLELRREFLKIVGHPERHAEHYTVDPGFQRHQTFRLTAQHTFKPTPWNGIVWMGGTLAAIAFTAWFMKTTRDAQEKLYRTGQVSYKDREFKFHS